MKPKTPEEITPLIVVSSSLTIPNTVEGIHSGLFSNANIIKKYEITEQIDNKFHISPQTSILIIEPEVIIVTAIMSRSRRRPKRNELREISVDRTNLIESDIALGLFGIITSGGEQGLYAGSITKNALRTSETRELLKRNKRPTPTRYMPVSKHKQVNNM